MKLILSICMFVITLCTGFSTNSKNYNIASLMSETDNSEYILADKGFIKQNSIQDIKFEDSYSEIFATSKIFTTPFTEQSNLVIVETDCSFTALNNTHIEEATFSIQPRRYEYSVSPTLSYFGGNVFYFDGFPQQSERTYEKTSSLTVSLGVTKNLGSKISISLSNDSKLEIEKNTERSFIISYTCSESISQPEPRIKTRLLPSFANQNNAGYEWTLNFAKDDTKSYILRSVYCFEIDNDIRGITSDNNVSLEFSGTLKTKDNKWFIPSTHTSEKMTKICSASLNF